MLWVDLRAYLQALEGVGDLRQVSGADWQEEIGTLTELMTEANGPALLFRDIPGYPGDHRVAANVFTTARRTALVFGLDAGGDLSAQWRARMAACEAVPPALVGDAPVTENVLAGEQVDLYRFPVPKWHEDDGGRYIGTGCCVINQGHDDGRLNVGTYRVSILDRRRCSIFIEPGKHGFVNARSHWMAGRRCPVVVTVGQEPILTALSMSSPYRPAPGLSELDLAGYFQGEPYPVVRGELTGLPIPATAEIALEGEIPSPDELLEPEGPFGEWTGYYAHGRQPELVLDVLRVYHRNGPVLLGQPPVRPVGCYYNPNLGNSDVDTLLQLRRAGLDSAVRVGFLGRPNFRAVAIRQSGPDTVPDAIRRIEPGGDQHMGHRLWVLVDDDIDVTNPAEVMWAMASRCIPGRAVTLVPGTADWQLDPRIPPGFRSQPDLGTDSGRRRYEAANLVLDCCRPWEWRDEFPPVAMNSRGLRERVREKWRSLFEGV